MDKYISMVPDPATDQILSGKLLRVYLLLICLACTLLALGWILVNCTRGFEFTDEGYYLTWTAHPFRYDWSISQFGFIYHPLYNLLRGNIGMLRQANVLIFLALVGSSRIPFSGSRCRTYTSQSFNSSFYRLRSQS